MTAYKVAFASARFCFALFIIMTSLYALLTYIPFTYFHFLPYLSWLPLFVKFHSFLYWLALGILTPTLVPNLRQQGNKRLTVEFLVFHVIAGAALLFRPLLSTLQNDDISFIWSIVALFPLMWLAAIDLSGHSKAIEWPDENANSDRPLLRPAVQSALFLALLFAGCFYVRSGFGGGIELRWSEQFAAIGWSTISHLFIFVSLVAALKLVRSVSLRFSSPAKAEFFIFYFLIGIASALILRRVVLPTIALSNHMADGFAVAVSFSLVAFLVGLRIRLYARSAAGYASGLEMALMAPGRARVSSKTLHVLTVVPIAVAAYAVPAALTTMDWDFLLQKLAVIGIWTLTFAAFYSMQSRAAKKNRSAPALALLVLACLGAYKLLGWSETRLAGQANNASFNLVEALERYSGHDISFRVAHEMLSPATDDDAFYSFLRDHTSVPQATQPTLLEVKLAAELTKTSGEKPNIFLFVVDSFRRDYLSPYNSAVDFTPHIDSFARESLVMANAFTHYGGTALAEPSIWAGGMLPHRRYGATVYSLNALQRLVEAEDYESFISIDRILQFILRPTPSIVPLDEGMLVGDAENRTDYMAEFSRTLKDLAKKLDQRKDRSRPVFAFTQPQNLHILMTYEREVPAGEQYPGFYAPYASRVKRVDAAFGEFIDYLKSSGLYDKSIVILTSDHGDALGEEGRWGHSYWIFPEIIRVPLIVHLPGKIQQELYSDPQAVAFTTDITPSLYYLLGHRPTARQNFGRPLFTRTGEEHDSYLRRSYLLASSYGAMYGILGNNGKSLYIANGVKDRDYFYDLADDPAGAHNRVTARIRAENQVLIRHGILSMEELYNGSGSAQFESAMNSGSERREPR